MTTKQKLTEFIAKRPHLIWYVKDYAALDAEAIVEATLNYEMRFFCHPERSEGSKNA